MARKKGGGSANKATFVIEAEDKTSATIKSIENQLVEIEKKMGKVGGQQPFEAVDKSAKQATGGVGRLKAAFSSVSAGAVAAGGVLAGVAAAVALVTHKTAELHAISMEAQKFGFGAESYQRLGHVATVAGSDVDALRESMVTLEEELDAIVRGGNTGLPAEALQELGLSAKSLQDVGPEEQLAVIAKALEGVADPADKARIAFKLMGTDGRQLLPLFNQGEAAIRKMNAEVGRVFTAEELARASAYQEQMTLLKKATSDLGSEITLSLAPAVTKTLELLEQSAKGWKIMIEDPAVLLTLFGEELEDNTKKVGTFTTKYAKQIGSLIPHTKEVTTSHQDRVKAYEGEVKALEHQTALAEAQGKTAKQMEVYYRQQHEARVLLYQTTGDIVALEAELNAEQIRRAAAQTARRGGSGPTMAERLQQAGDIQIKIWEDRISLMEAEAELAGKSEESAYEAARIRRDLQIQSLEVERQALEITRAKNSLEREANAARIEAIGREQELLAKQQEIELQKEANRLVAEAVALQAKQAAAQAQANAQLREVELAHLEDQRSRLEENASIRLASAHTDREKAMIQSELDSQLHAVRLAQIQKEKQARLEAFEAEKQALLSQPKVETSDLAKLEHDQKMAMMQSELEMRQTLAAEEARIANESTARFQSNMAQFQEAFSAVASIQSQITGIVQTEVARARGIQDEAHAKKMEEMRAETEGQVAALDKQIEDAKENDSLKRKLERQKEKLQEKSRKDIEKAELEHQEKRKRQEMRFAGFQLLIQAAIDTAKAVSEFASFNFVQGALHVASAVLNTAYGIALLSGVIPTGGGGGGGAAAAGASGTGSDSGGREGSEAQLTPDSMPGNAARAQGGSGARPGEGNAGGVTFNGNVTINSLGTIDENSAEQIGFGIGKAAYSREGVSPA